MAGHAVRFRGERVMSKTTTVSIILTLALACLASCSGSSASSSGSTSRGSTSVDRCRDRSGGGVSHDEAREAHQSGDQTGAYRTAGYGSRSAADRPPEWWGRSEVDPCDPDDAPPDLSGPLLLDSTQPDDDIDGDGDDHDTSATDL